MVHPFWSVICVVGGCFSTPPVISKRVFMGAPRCTWNRWRNAKRSRSTTRISNVVSGSSLTRRFFQKPCAILGESKQAANLSHRIHRTGIFTYNWLIFMVNVDKYTIHGWYGYGNLTGFPENNNTLFGLVKTWPLDAFGSSVLLFSSFTWPLMLLPETKSIRWGLEEFYAWCLEGAGSVLMQVLIFGIAIPTSMLSRDTHISPPRI